MRFNHPANSTEVGHVVGLYLCPDAPSDTIRNEDFGGNSYAANSGTEPGKDDGVMFPLSNIRLSDIVDGTSHTVSVGEIFYENLGWARGAVQGGGGGGGGNNGGCDAGFARGVARWWKCCSGCALPGLNPPPTSCNNSCERKFQYSSFHEGGAFFALADGHVLFV